jgi:hypothetical protein
LDISSIQLLVVRWYPGSRISAMEARAELGRRGWSRLRQLAAIALLLPVIAPDRIMRRADVARDDGDESGTPRQVGFSALFSTFMVSLIGALVSAWLIINRHDAGQPYQWRWLLGWTSIAAISGWAARATARRRA